MNGFQAMLFDLDDTLLNRNQAVDQLFSLIVESFYEDVDFTVKKLMLHKFKGYDKESYGLQDKTKVLESFFDEFPPTDRLARDCMQDYWNHNFPKCFSIDPQTVKIINAIKEHAKVAIITNGSAQRQTAKILNTSLNQYFDHIIISEEAGFSKPDKGIFELALNKLNVQPEDALFVGDDIEIDIAGCQNVNMKGIWFNPQKMKNETEIKPYAVIDSLERLLDFLA